MSISLYFGLPGAGKTTLMAKMALRGVRSKRYQNVYGNVEFAINGYTYVDNECFGKYELVNALVLIDEATLFADNRSYKSFPQHLVEWVLKHRHDKIDIVLFTQQWDGVDKKIRVITDRVFYVYKPFFTRSFATKYYRIPYGIIIPDKNASEKYGEIIQGYCKPNILVRLLSPWCIRPFYYEYFDSWERTPRPPLPDKYKAYSSPKKSRFGGVKTWLVRKNVLPMRKKRNQGISVFSCIWTIKNTLLSLKLLRDLKKP